MYAYGMTHPNPEGTYFDAHFFILGTGSFFILDDGWMDTLIQKEREEEKTLTEKQLKQRFEEGGGTISDAIFYGHAMMDSIR
jgi:hypothetical protein